ncbi:MAG: hypothetical protein Unbinned1322contig1000_26 [Prokaryotic dsDNA virus sp.]|nr:hypothetical protein [Aequorivita sp.]QDP57282.1 MAG: hypothetical protein Unbinned1322contig1000_26 [Prokaryotic dsDNA virus sp.]|tara:strand:+ start:9618 stop:10277 length:660 start_codon:yes stop_codon:yes gene_type:complete
MKWPCKRNETTPTIEPPIDGPIAERQGKTGCLIGHTARDKGANNKKWYATHETWEEEYQQWITHYDLDGNEILAEYELNLASAKFSELCYQTRDEGRGRRGAAEDLAEADCTEIISMHCNSYNGEVPGYEFWYLDGCIESKRFAQELHDAFKKKFPNHVSRGIKKAKRGSRAYGVLDACRDHGVRRCALAEWYFLDVESDFIPPEKIGEFLKEFGLHGG